MARLYADENYPYPVVLILRGMGHDVLTAQADGRAGYGVPDVDVLARAIQLNRCVLTEDRRDYRRLHNNDQNHPGIITCTRDPDWLALAPRIHDAITSLPSLHGQLIKIIRPGK